MDMGPPQDVSQGRRSTHVLVTDFIGLQGQSTVWLHPCVGKPLLLTCNLGLHTGSRNIWATSNRSLLLSRTQQTLDCDGEAAHPLLQLSTYQQTCRDTVLSRNYLEYTPCKI